MTNWRANCHIVSLIFQKKSRPLHLQITKKNTNMETKVYLLKYTVQENSAYIVGILSAHMSMKSAAQELATTMADLENNGWTRKDRGMSLESIRTAKIETSTLRLYSVEYHQPNQHRDMQLHIEPLTAKP